jgi:hypothetical protein
MFCCLRAPTIGSSGDITERIIPTLRSGGAPGRASPDETPQIRSTTPDDQTVSEFGSPRKSAKVVKARQPLRPHVGSLEAPAEGKRGTGQSPRDIWWSQMASVVSAVERVFIRGCPRTGSSLRKECELIRPTSSERALFFLCSRR